MVDIKGSRSVIGVFFRVFWGVCLTSTLVAAQNPLIHPIQLPNIPQNAFDYLDKSTQNKPILSVSQQKRQAREALKKYQAPWAVSKDSAWLLSSEYAVLALYRTSSDNYGFNYQKIPASFMTKIASQMNLSKIRHTPRKALIVQNTNLRALPTDLPMYHDFHTAGEGYPFDNLQISVEWSGTPVGVYALSQDGSWALVQVNDISGWVKINDMAYVDASIVKKFQTKSYVAITRDGAAIKDRQGNFLFYAHIGMLFPVVHHKILVPLKEDRGYATLKEAVIDKNNYAAFPLSPTPRHFAMLINRMLGEPYGWGGLYYFRDCSLTLKDLLMPFGVWLPRNSQSQADAAHKITLANLSEAKKQEMIQRKGKPFLTLLHMHGHITLYIGQKKGDGIIFQNKWGITTDDAEGHEGRAVIGVSHIAPLSFGAKVLNSKTTLINSIDSMTIF